MDTIWNILGEAVRMPFEYLTDPEKRVFWPFLLSSFTIGLLVYFINRKSLKTGFLDYFFNKKRWLGRSAITDYSLMFFNAVIKVVLVAPFLIYSLRISFYITDWLVMLFGRPSFHMNTTMVVLLFTVTSFVVKDFFSFLLHYLQHRIPVLWYFHKVHHSATDLNPFTQYRIHPVELLLNNARNILITVFLIGIFDYIAGVRVQAYELMGVNILSFLFLATGANLRHSHIQLKYPDWMERIVISPFQHQVHHSTDPNHHNKNMGSKLAVWDWLFGTLIRSQNNEVKSMKFGIGEQKHSFDGFIGNLTSPFLDLFTFKQNNRKQ